MSKRTINVNADELQLDISIARTLGLTALLSVLEQSVDAVVDAEAEAARHLVCVEKQQRHLLRLTKVCDEFHTGEKAPRALGYKVIGGVEGAPSYNELARLHRNQRETIIEYQQDAATTAVCTLPGKSFCSFRKETA